MEPAVNEAHFWELYQQRYTKILDTAREFLERTGAEKEKTAVFIRCVGRNVFDSPN